MNNNNITHKTSARRRELDDGMPMQKKKRRVPSRPQARTTSSHLLSNWSTVAGLSNHQHLHPYSHTRALRNTIMTVRKCKKLRMELLFTFSRFHFGWWHIVVLMGGALSLPKVPHGMSGLRVLYPVALETSDLATARGGASRGLAQRRR